MENPYKILGVKNGSSISEIKRAYRAKAKLLHPDSGNTKDSAAFRELQAAYELLSDTKSKSLFDESFAMHKREKNTKTWDYRTWLLSRDDDESAAKLIFFDLMHAREDDSVLEFKKAIKERANFRLSAHFSRGDFMDYGFILCEELVLRSEYYDAFLLLEQIIKMEKAHEYFRHFFPEVMDLARSILKTHIEHSVPDELALDSWERALELGFGKKDDAFFLMKMAGAYRRIGDERTARICEEESKRM